MKGLFITFTPTYVREIPYEPEVETFLTAISVPNDGTVYFGSTAYEILGSAIWTNLDTCVKAIKTALSLTWGTNNLSTKFKFIYPRIGGTASAHAYNLVTGTADGTYSGGWTHDGSGALPNGTNAYMDLNINYTNANFTNNNQSFGFISKTNTLSGVYADFGMINDGRSNAVMYTNGTSLVTRLNSETNKSLTISNSSGLFSMSRIASTTYKVYKDGASIGTHTDNSTAMYTPPQGFKLVEGALYNAGSLSVGFYSPRKRTWFWGGLGMTDGQMLDIYNALANFETALNR